MEIEIKGLSIVRDLIYSMRRIYQHPSTPPKELLGVIRRTRRANKRRN